MFRAYNKKEEYSYSMGVFPTIELVKNRPGDVLAVLVHSRLVITHDIADALSALPKSAVRIDDVTVERLSKKGSTLMIGVFAKREYPFLGGNQIVLHTPSDAGNLGTIIRTAVGFGIRDVVLIGDAVDVYDPKTVRASMGALFRIGICRYTDMASYSAANSLPKYLFMLGAKLSLNEVTPNDEPFALVFGNESSGLPQEAAMYGTPIVIRHTHDIDSLALPQAVAIGLYHFTIKETNKWKDKQ